jgi:hypothetical protein
MCNSSTAFRGAACAPVAPCPACGRKFRRRRAAREMAPLPLFEWRRQRPGHANASRGAVRLLLLDACRDPDGAPRPALILPGRSLPVVFRTMAAALDAQRRAEGWQ